MAQSTRRIRARRRAAEIRRLNALTPAQVAEQAAARLHVAGSIDDLHLHFAEAIATAVRRGKEVGRELALILPWGPVGQYPLVGRLLREEGLSLRHCTLFFMDEYADSTGRAVLPDHPLSFRGAAMQWLGTLPSELRPDPRNVLFPDGSNAQAIDTRIHDLGGIDACFGGVGIHGHIAFNEPEAGVSGSGIRLVSLNEFTRTINSIRAGVGGDLENFPREAWTLGLRQCLSARRIQLYIRSDAGLDWAKTILRLSVLGTPGDDYPVTWIRQHADYLVVTTRETLESPALQLP